MGGVEWRIRMAADLAGEVSAPGKTSAGLQMPELGAPAKA